MNNILLNNLALKYNTDKRIGKHGYVNIYSKYFEQNRLNIKKVLEIGIFNGGSHKMWQSYFPNAIIYGIDIYNKSEYNSDRIKTYIGNSEKIEDLTNFINKYGSEFDIIIDDGGHTMLQQQNALKYLFKFIKPNGYYIIEDIHTSLRDKFIKNDIDKNNTTLDVIQNYINKKEINSYYIQDIDKQYLENNIKECKLYILKPGPKGSIMSVMIKK